MIIILKMHVINILVLIFNQLAVLILVNIWLKQDPTMQHLNHAGSVILTKKES